MKFIFLKFFLLIIAVQFSVLIAFSQDEKPTLFSEQLSNKLLDLPFEYSTAIEARNGIRLHNKQPYNNNYSIGELRWQSKFGFFLNDWSEIELKADIGYDAAYSEVLFDLRTFNIDIYPQSWWSIKLGRQILTWGKGDLVFINDLFPKDYVSFLLGRDIQILKSAKRCYQAYY